VLHCCCAAPTSCAFAIADTTTNSGTSAFSAVSVSASIEITAVNDAPTLDTAKSPVLDPQAEDALAAVGSVGTALADLEPNWSQDVDTNAARGYAIVGTNNANGSWWFSTNDGASWSLLGSPSETSALLLDNSAGNRLYFQPNANYQGTISDAITVRAWDMTEGASGDVVNITTTGGSSAYSTATDTASITVTTINDTPSITGLNSSQAYTENSAPILLDTDAEIVDLDLREIDNFAGMTLTIERNGGADPTDLFSIQDGPLISENNGNLGGIGTVDSSNGRLTITFHDNNGIVPPQVVVNDTLRQIAYANSGDALPDNIELHWQLSDGNTGAQGRRCIRWLHDSEFHPRQ